MNLSSPIVFYFNLQLIRIIRFLKDNGLYPIIVFPVLGVLFIFCSVRLLSSFDSGEFIYALIGLSLSGAFIQSPNDDFLKRNLNSSNYQWIKIGEPIVKILPFIGFLLFYGFPLLVSLVVVLIICSSFFKSNLAFPSTFPTPFSQRPFEFARGFRAAVFPLFGIYLLCYLGIRVDNFNLSLATMAGLALICANFYVNPEPQILVWLHKMSPNKFLIIKMRNIIIHFFLLASPIIFTLLIFNYQNWTAILFTVIGSVLFIQLCMLTKYAAYPTEINIIQGLAIGFSILLPPLMLIAVPFFYRKAVVRLKLFIVC